MPEFPVQLSKVQAPPLRDETLARDRLLDWLSVKIHRRVVLLTAEAGYGKTTLLADFTRRTRLRILWFRLDRGDRDWTVFMAHLVAAVRVHLPEFGVATRSRLGENVTTRPPLEAVLDTFLGELVALPTEAAVMIFDDFHLVDDSVDIRHLVRGLMTRGPERLTFVFASRREPQIRLARLRALGEVAELGTDELRFDRSETEQLFRDTYEMPLEPTVLVELSRRTEGWAASLQLIRAALHDRDPGQVRAFISSLTGAEGHLYDYLAEEVVGELPNDLQQFLMRTSVLDTVDLALGPIAAAVSVEEARRFIEDGERHGLFGKRGRRGPYAVRAHPLVRDFLHDRLTRTLEPDEVEDLHARIGSAAETIDWQISARHYLEAGSITDAERVLSAALVDVLGTGAYSAAQELAGHLPGRELPGAPGLVVRSRMAIQRGERSAGLELAEAAHRADPRSTPALLNVLQARSISGDIAGALTASRLLGNIESSTIAKFGPAFEAVIDTSLSGSLGTAEAMLGGLAEDLRRASEEHFLGVTLLNLALVQFAKGDIAAALASADEAVSLLSRSSAGLELVSARLARAAPLAVLGRIDDARAEIEMAKTSAAPAQINELVAEIGWIEGMLGDGTAARPYLEELAGAKGETEDSAEHASLALALIRVADGDVLGAAELLSDLRFGVPTTSMAFEAQRHYLAGLVMGLQQAPGSVESIRTGIEVARKQGAGIWLDYGTTLLAMVNRGTDPSATIELVAGRRSFVLSMLAETIARRLSDLSSSAFDAVIFEAEQRPYRWRPAIRRAIREGHADGRLRAALVLERIGDASDVRRLRDSERDLKGHGGMRLGFGLARRLAPRVLVEDLGRVRIVAGPTVTEGTAVRRKVLALLCLLLTRPRFVLTRDEVLDSLWQDHDPSSALNSLNQTVYFLRRVFEPRYSEDTTPGYVGQDGETIWLDDELTDCTSRRCLEMIRSMPTEPTPEGAVLLATAYRGRFALDFAYEDWAEPYRASLHAGYLRVMEQAIRMDMDSGHVDRGIFLAERAAEIEPDSEEIQLALARLYRQAGAHAAAAERYGRYSKSMTDLGVEPQSM